MSSSQNDHRLTKKKMDTGDRNASNRSLTRVAPGTSDRRVKFHSTNAILGEQMSSAKNVA